jgi:hypothetical protein
VARLEDEIPPSGGDRRLLTAQELFRGGEPTEEDLNYFLDLLQRWEAGKHGSDGYPE